MAEVPIGDIFIRHAAQKPSGEIALVYPDQSLTWQQLDHRAERWAAAMRSHGVRQDDNVVLTLPNCSEFHEALIGIWKLGASPVVLPHRLPEGDFRALCELARPSLIVGDAPEGCSPGISNLSRTTDLTAFNAEPIESAISTYWKTMTSGGSTGRPKLIVDRMRGSFDPDVGGRHEFMQIPENSVMLNPGPLYHTGPFLFTSYALLRGTRVIGMERFDAEEVLKLIEKHQVSWVSFVPTMMHRIWSLPERVRNRYDLSSLDTVWHLAAPCPQWLKRAWIDWLGPNRMWELFAGTEGLGSAVINGNDWLAKPGSVGKVLPSSRAKVVDEDGQECGPGEIGELYFQPVDGKMRSHYIGSTLHRDEAGWATVGDMGWIDEDGYLFIADRRTDMILRGGANIFPAEIEAALEAFQE
mgnify:CR=1 FL=1